MVAAVKCIPNNMPLTHFLTFARTTLAPARLVFERIEHPACQSERDAIAASRPVDLTRDRPRLQKECDDKLAALDSVSGTVMTNRLNALLGADIAYPKTWFRTTIDNHIAKIDDRIDRWQKISPDAKRALTAAQSQRDALDPKHIKLITQLDALIRQTDAFIDIATPTADGLADTREGIKQLAKDIYPILATHTAGNRAHQQAEAARARGDISSAVVVQSDALAGTYTDLGADDDIQQRIRDAAQQIGEYETLYLDQMKKTDSLIDSLSSRFDTKIDALTKELLAIPVVKKEYDGIVFKEEKQKLAEADAKIKALKSAADGLRAAVTPK